jgi:PBP1b-binding outer membrane lipoprotein LpoB
MAINRTVGLMLSGLAVIVLSGCRADDAATAGAAPDHAQTVERAADVEHVPAQPVDTAMAMRPAQATGEGVPAETVEMKRSEDGATLEARQRDAAVGSDGAASGQVQPAH